MITIDQLGRKVKLDSTPTRIISLVPSQTELLFDLGLEDEIVGITKFCVHPEVLKQKKEIIGGTKNINIDKVKMLAPDLIVANKEENDAEQISLLSAEFPIWVSDIQTFKHALEMIRELGRITSRETKAEAIQRTVNSEFDSLNEQMRRTKKKRALYVIWKEPFLSVGNDTFIHEMMHIAGFENVLEDKTRYPEFTIQEIREKFPEVILLSSEPFPFCNKHLEEFREYFPDEKVFFVDGEMFSWYGSRLIKAPGYFKSLLKDVNSAL